MKHVALTLLAAIVLSTAAFAAEPQPDKSYLQRLLADWSTMDLNKIGAYYSQDPNNTYYDVAPMQFKGWQQWAATLQQFFTGYKTFKLSLVGEPELHKQGNLVWGTYLWHLEAERKDGGKDTWDGRDTTVWMKQNGKWLIVHEHDSLPVPMPTPEKK